VSGQLEILDFDAPETFTPWGDMVDAIAPGLLPRLPLVQTPSDGKHVYYRSAVIEGNQRLAQRPDAKGRPEVMIETRGEGGYAIIPPSPPTCHPRRKPYLLLRGDLATIPSITSEERAILLNAARSFNQWVKPARVISGAASPGATHTYGDRPGDILNANARWADILEPHGWIHVGQRGQATLWKRPGKQARGCSATTNFGGSDLLFVFSSNAWPFAPETAYTKFSAYTWLEHEGDFNAAAKALASRYGIRRPPRVQAYDPWLGPRAQWHGIPTPVWKEAAR
jgi:putative DNA primase/helicase